MFTGLIEAVGRVASREPLRGGVRFAVETDLADGLTRGESLAHNGVCLTVVDVDGRRLFTDVSPETLRVTNLGFLEPGALVNLERPVRADSRVGGHFVQGHVDGTGRILAIVDEGDFRRVTYSWPEELAPYLIPKGSIAIDGISLTVAALRPGELDVQIIPHTWQATNLQAARVGDVVNLECDMLGKYVVRLMALREEGRAPASAAGIGASNAERSSAKYEW